MKITFYLILILIVLFGWALFEVTVAHAIEASWYSEASLKKEGTWAYSKGVMANGKQFDENAYTCASRDWPLGTLLRVTLLPRTTKVCKRTKWFPEYPKGVLVLVTDRTHKRFAGKRIDLSKRAFSAIADLKQGLVQVTIEEVLQ